MRFDDIPWRPVRLACIRGLMCHFDDGPMLLVLTREQRDFLGMSDETYQTLNVLLRIDQEKRERGRNNA